MSRTSLKDVAKEAGVSVVTASLVLNGASSRSQARVSAARRKQILEVAGRLNYRINAAGRLLKSKKNRDIGLIFFEQTEQVRFHPDFTDINIQFTRICRELGFRHQTDWFDSRRYPDEIPALMTDGLIGGLLIAGNPFNAAAEYLEKNDFLPCVRLGELGKYCVLHDPAPAFLEAMEYLAATGHRRIAMLNAPEFIRQYRLIRQIFLENYRRLGFEHDESLYSQVSPYEDFAAAVSRTDRQFFDRPDRPDALLCATGAASRSMVSLIQKRGLGIPDDISIISYALLDWENTQFLPRLTAVEHNFAQLAERGIHLLRMLMDDLRPEQQQILIPETFRIRNTVRDRRGN